MGREERKRRPLAIAATSRGLFRNGVEEYGHGKAERSSCSFIWD